MQQQDPFPLLDETPPPKPKLPPKPVPEPAEPVELDKPVESDKPAVPDKPDAEPAVKPVELPDAPAETPKVPEEMPQAPQDGTKDPVELPDVELPDAKLSEMPKDNSRSTQESSTDPILEPMVQEPAKVVVEAAVPAEKESIELAENPIVELAADAQAESIASETVEGSFFTSPFFENLVAEFRSAVNSSIEIANQQPAKSDKKPIVDVVAAEEVSDEVVNQRNLADVTEQSPAAALVETVADSEQSEMIAEQAEVVNEPAELSNDLPGVDTIVDSEPAEMVNELPIVKAVEPKVLATTQEPVESATVAVEPSEPKISVPKAEADSLWWLYYLLPLALLGLVVFVWRLLRRSDDGLVSQIIEEDSESSAMSSDVEKDYPWSGSELEPDSQSTEELDLFDTVGVLANTSLGNPKPNQRQSTVVNAEDVSDQEKAMVAASIKRQFSERESELQGQVAEMQAQLDLMKSAEADSVSLQDEADRQSRRAVEAEEQLDSLRNELSLLLQQLESSKDESEEFQRKWQASQAENHQLKAEVDSLQLKQTESEKQNLLADEKQNLLLEQLADKKLEVSNLKEVMAGEAKLLENQQRDAKNDRAILDNQLSQLRKQLDHQKRESAKQLDVQVAKNSQLKSRLELKSAKAAQLQQQLTDQKSASEQDMDSRSKDAKQQLERLANEKAGLEKQILAHLDQASDAEQEQERLATESTELLQQLAFQKSETDRLRKLVNSLEQQALAVSQATAGQPAEVQSDMGRIEKHLVAAKAHNLELQKMLDRNDRSHTKELLKLRHRLSEAENSLAISTESQESLARQLRTATDRVSLLIAEVEYLRANRRKARILRQARKERPEALATVSPEFARSP